MPVGLVQFSSIALAGVFAWSALAKLARFPTWRSLLARYRIGALEVPARVLVPTAELAVSLLVILQRTFVAAAFALALLAAFSIAVMRLRALEGDRLPCGCFGDVKVRDYRVVLARSALLALLCAVILLRGDDVAPLGGIALPGRQDAVPVALTVLGLAAVAWLMISVLRAGKKGTD